MKIKWDQDTKRVFESGVDRGVLYLKNTKQAGYEKGEGWNGMTKVTESPEGGDSNPVYANNNTYLNVLGKEKFKGSISAYTYPDTFAECDGSAYVTGTGNKQIGVRITGQTRRPFGLTYRTGLGNDAQGLDYGYLIHLVYNATASVSSRDYSTINESPEAIEFSWDFNTTPTDVPGYKPTAHLVVDSTRTDPVKLKALEDKLYGTDNTEPTLPLPEEVFTILGRTS